MKHRHHIIPRHMGGGDSDGNLVELTIPEHAEAHRLLYEKYGKREDYLAWKMLEGQAKDPEVWALKSAMGAAVANRNGAPAKGRKWAYNPEDPTERKMVKELPEGWKYGRGKNTWAANRDYKNVSDSHRAKTSASTKKAWAEGRCDHRKSIYGNYSGRKTV